MILVVAEKPSVGNSIADVLGANEKKEGYREGNGYQVTWCVGHLVEPAQPEEYDEALKKWSYETLPIVPVAGEWKYRVKDDVVKQFKTVSSLMNDKDVTEIIEATDAGREGELIFRLAYNQAGCRKQFSRLWISSMEEAAIREGIETRKPGSKYDSLYKSALARQQADWLVGINGTRLFTVKYSGRVLKVGRVQTPTLAMLTQREKEITSFTKTPFYTVGISMGGIKALSERMDDKSTAEKCADICNCGEATVVSVTRQEKSEKAPRLYDLTSLQRDANRIFGFTAKETLDAAQFLYEKKLITYPRTDSRYLSDDMKDTAGKTVEMLKQAVPYVTVFESDDTEPDVDIILNSSKVTDHHAIIPTMSFGSSSNRTGLGPKEERVLYLVATRMLEATAGEHRYVSEQAEFGLNGYAFRLKGKTITDNGWKYYSDLLRDYYSVTANEKKNKDNEDEEDDETVIGGVYLEEGMTLQVTGSEVREGFTKPPAHFTEATLLSAMEKAGADEMDDEVERKGLGTPATRADIIEKLVRDGFVARYKKRLIPTDAGIKLIDILPENVKSPRLTAEWENELVRVSKGEASYDDFMDNIRKMVFTVVSENKPAEGENPFSTPVGKCPHCGADVLTGKFGMYCKNKCGMVFSYAFGMKLSEDQSKKLLEGKKILLKGLKSKNGNHFDAYLEPDGTEEKMIKDHVGNERKIYQYKFKMTFPERKNK